jgi:hypothetical protein
MPFYVGRFVDKFRKRFIWCTHISLPFFHHMLLMGRRSGIVVVFLEAVALLEK